MWAQVIKNSGIIINAGKEKICHKKGCAKTLAQPFLYFSYSSFDIS